jgi:Yeast cortical protein KAR9
MIPATQPEHLTSSLSAENNGYPPLKHLVVDRTPVFAEGSNLTTSFSSQSHSHRPAPPLARPPIPGDQGSSHHAPSTSLQATPTQSSPLPLRDLDPNTSTPNSASHRLLRKPGPGLLARLKLLDTRSRRRSSTSSQTAIETPSVGRIPEQQLQKLDQLHRDHQILVERKGTAWTATTPPEAELSLPTSGATSTQVAASDSLDTGPSFQSTVMAALAHDERSDISSIISASDRPVLSESDESDEVLDTQKYRLPDTGKLRGSSRTGFVMEDGRTVERDVPPTPPPKDFTSTSNRQSGFFNSSEDFSGSADSYFNPYGMSRAASIYTLSRASFSNQISQLTSIKLPQASSLSSSISAIPTSTVAARALNDAADQIKRWIKKATEVLEGLDAEDDVEWAAAGGREGIGEVDVAINRFESLIDVYVGAIEELESRPDVEALSALELKSVVDRMERILTDWDGIKNNLEGVKQQVEIAMEWEELWNTVLGEIGMEQENLRRHIFEMEERRHKNSLLDSLAEPGQGLDIKELETIVEEAPAVKAAEAQQRNQDSDEESTKPAAPQEDSNLLALFARMQPLRASLDFLPMRLSAFLGKARPIFPTACEELETRMQQLEGKYKTLEGDAESLRKELGEDRWVLIFRKAGRQALKMCESVERSVAKLRDALEEGIQHTNPASLVKRIENYEAKKEHYGPAIQQVLAIIDRGVQTRLTVNGEILRLQADMQRRWEELGSHLKGMDFALEQLNVSKTRQLRDSLSTILSEQRSVTSSAGTLVDTPGSSPASSVVLLSRQSSDQGTTTPFSSKSRQGSFASSTTTRARRLSSLPVSNPSPALRKTPVSKSSASNLRASGVSSRLYPPPTPRSVSRAESHTDMRPSKPRWNSSTSMNDTLVGHNFKPLTATMPSPYRKDHTLRTQRSFSSGFSTNNSSAIPSPLGRSFHSAAPSRPSSTVPPTTPHTSALPRPKLGAASTTSGIPSLKPPMGAKTPSIPRASSAYITPTPATPPPDSTTRKHFSRASIASSASSSATATTTLTDRTTIRNAPLTPSSPPDNDENNNMPDDEYSPSSSRTTRPSTALAGNRRTSLLPQPKRAPSSSTTTSSAAATASAAAQAAMSGRTTPATGGARRAASRLSSFGFGGGDNKKEGAKPRWR